MVALLTEGVDRNKVTLNELVVYDVALLTEGVDRNLLSLLWEPQGWGRPPHGGRG